MAEKSIYEHEVEDLRQKCEKGCEEVEELRQRLEEVIHVRDRLQEEVQVLTRERQNEQEEVGAELLMDIFTICADCSWIVTISRNDLSTVKDGTSFIN